MADVTEIAVIALEITLSCVRCGGHVRAAVTNPWRIDAACEGCGAAMMFSATVPSFVDKDAPWRA